MMNKKILFIAGASSDVGTGLIKNCYMNYDLIYAHYNRTSAGLEEIKEQLGGRLKLFKADLLKMDETLELIEEIKKTGEMPTHFLHLPSAKYENYKFKKAKWDRFENDINIQLRSAVVLLNALLPEMSKNRYGKIVLMLSSVISDNAPKYLSSYVTVKYALLGLMKSLASEYADKSICINGISPCMMETKLLSEVSDIVIQQNAGSNPAGRNACVDDVIPAIEFLLSQDSDFITGQNIVISGGGK